MRTAAVGMLVALVAAPSLRAQAPTITSEGDPSVRDDTIYALTVDPADHPEEAAVLLLDDGVVRYEADGRGSRTYRMVAQVLKPEAVEGWAENTFTWDPERERFRLNWARVLDRDGRVISAEPMHRQEADLPVPEGAPVFTARKQLRISLGGVAPGTIGDYSYTVETVEPVLEGDFFAAWYVNPGSTIRRSRLVLDLPDGANARIHEVDLAFEPDVRRVDGRIVRVYARSDLERIEPEPFAPDSTGFSQHIRYGGVVDWPEIGRWYGSLATDRYRLTPAVEERLTALTADAETPEEALRRVHRWIAQDVRYVSLSLGIGGYQPRYPDAVLETLSGDCKDKTTLFIVMARALGFQADPVLTSSASVDETVPSLHQFDHVIARLDRPDGPLYVDLTAGLVPFGELPGELHGRAGLLVPADDDPRLVTFPDPPATASRMTVRVTGTLDSTGAFTGEYHEAGTGLMQYGLRQAFSQDLTRQQRANTAQAIATQLFDGARGSGLSEFDGRDLDATPSVRIQVEAAGATSTTPDGDHILTLPIATFGNQDLLRYLESREERRAPFHIGMVSGDAETLHELVVELPEGWTAVLPESAVAESRFGRYESEYVQEGRTLRVRRHYLGGRGIAPPAAREELIEWLKGIVADSHRYVVLRPGES